MAQVPPATGQLKGQGFLAVMAESFEHIHRSNLIGTGVLPLMFPSRTSRLPLKLSGEETEDTKPL